MTLNLISCWAAGSCVATGNDVDGGVAETLANEQWTVAQFPPPANVASENFLSCAAPAFCVAVGVSGFQIGIETLSNGSWSATQAPLPANAAVNDPDAFPTGVSCPSAGSCIALGDYHDNTGSVYGGHGVAESLADGVWTATMLPAPADIGTEGYGAIASRPGLSSLYCASVQSCITVGEYANSSGDAKTLVETLANGTWTATGVSLPADAAAGNAGIDAGGPGALTCVGVTFCVAVGAYNLANTNPQEVAGMIQTLSGGTWTAIEAPLPAGASPTNTGISTVSCWTANGCVALGSYSNDTVAQGVIEALGSSVTPPPTNSLQAHIYLCTAQGSPTTTVVPGGYLTAFGPQFFVSKSTMSEANVKVGTYSIYSDAPHGYNFVSCGQGPVSTPAKQTVTVPPGGVANFYVNLAPPSPTSQVTSKNWAGYTLLTSSLKPLSVQVTVPTPETSCTTNSQAAFWIGYNGGNGVNTNYLPQVGFDMDCQPGAQSSQDICPGKTGYVYYFWWEMNPHAGSNPLCSTGPRPGQTVGLIFTPVGHQLYAYYEIFASNGNLVSIGFLHSFAPPQGANYSSMECIAEDPTLPSSPGLSGPPATLSDFNVVNFAGCSAIDDYSSGLTLIESQMGSGQNILATTTPISLDSQGVNHFSVTWMSGNLE